MRLLLVYAARAVLTAAIAGAAGAGSPRATAIVAVAVAGAVALCCCPALAALQPGCGLEGGCHVRPLFINS